MERSSVGHAVAAFLVTTVGVVVLFAVGIGPLYERGLAVSTDWPGALLHVPIALAMAALAWAVLQRWLRRPADEEGWSTPDLRTALRLASGLGVGGAGAVAVALLAGAVELAPADRWPTASRLASALVAFLGSAVVQQLALHTMASTLRRRVGAVRAALIAVLIFTAFHVDDRSTALTLTNAALFGALMLALIRGFTPASFSLSTGVHAGWNFTQAIVLASPLGGVPTEWGYFRWIGAPTGVEGTWACCVMLLLGLLVALTCFFPGRVGIDIDLPASPERAFTFLADFANDVHWRANVVAMRPLGNASDALGGAWSRQVEVRQVPGRQVETEAVITRFEPPQHLAVRRASGPIRPEARYVLQPSGAGTRLRFDLVVALDGPRRLLLPLVALLLFVVVRPSLRPDFERLAQRLR